MLTADTKRHIDTARQILVGKVPDPKAQIDQITNALIYKFMDDMDVKAKDAGGRASFFTGDLEKYAWRKLMDPRKGAQERLNMYVEALEKFSAAKQLPQLFRDIFRQAFLPYRDPETLNLFLKEIEFFDYNHSEELGNAFEYLLSIMGSQGDAGQFRTPRHIIDFIVKVIDPDKDDTILDPACGTAGFLISAYKHIVEKHDGVDENGKKNHEKPLTHQEKQKLMNNLEGYDISSDMVKLARVNMYLHGNNQPKIYEYDSLTSEERWGDNFSVIMANPPFMSPKGGIRPHNKFGVESSRAEVLFVDYIMSHLKQNGRAGIIVPEGVIFQSGKAYKQLRKALIEDGLMAVISLPSGVFNPYAGVKTSILIFDNNRSKKSDQIVFAKVERDGFDLGSQRRPTPGKDDLPIIAKLLRAYRENPGSDIQELKSELANSNLFRVGVSTIGGPDTVGSSAEVEQIEINSVSREKIAESGDYNLSASRYIVAETNQNQKWPMIELGKVAEFINGYGFNKEDWKNEGKPIIRIQNLTGTSSEFNYTDTTAWPEKYKVTPHDLLISWSASIGFYIWKGPEAYLNQHIFNVKVDETKILKKYLYFLSEPIINEIKKLVHGNTMTHVTRKDFEKIKIPLPSLAKQKEIVEELDRYQKIIDGAKQVMENYKPNINIDISWPVVPLPRVAFFQEGPGIRSYEYDNSPNAYPIINVRCVRNGSLDLSDCKSVKKELAIGRWKHFQVEKGDILFTTSGTIGRSSIVHAHDLPLLMNTSVVRFRSLNPKKLNNNYLKAYLSTPFFINKLRSMSTGSAQQNVGPSHIKQLTISLPPLETQQQIATKLEQEEKLINSNKTITKIYEQKIKDKIAEVWAS